MAKASWVDRELAARYDTATAAGLRAARTEPRAARATYMAKQRALSVELTNGAALTIPIKLVAALEHATAAELGSVSVSGAGGGLFWDRLDLDLSVPALVGEIFGGPAWVAELGRLGGQRSTPAKAAAARRNGRKGGRPRTTRGGERRTQRNA